MLGGPEVSCRDVKCPSTQKAQEVEAPPPHPDQEEQLEGEGERERERERLNNVIHFCS